MAEHFLLRGGRRHRGGLFLLGRGDKNERDTPKDQAPLKNAQGAHFSSIVRPRHHVHLPTADAVFERGGRRRGAVT